MSSAAVSPGTSSPSGIGLRGTGAQFRAASVFSTGVCLAMLALIFRERMRDLLHNTQSIQLFVLAVSFGLLLLRTRRSVFTQRFTDTTQGATLLGAALAGLIALDTWKRPIVSSTPLLMACASLGIIWTLYGRREARRQIFPTGYLLLMTPIPVVVTVAIDLPLQIASASLGCSLARILGIGVQRFGTTIRLQHADVSLRIIGDCNGLRSGIAMFAVAVLFGWLLETSMRKRLALVVVAIAFAYAGNILRITTLLVLLSHFGERFVPYFSRFESWFGALVFALCIAALYLVAKGSGCTRFREI